VRLYDRLFRVADPLASESDYMAQLNPASLETLSVCRLELGLATAAPGEAFQFERLGYFCADAVDSQAGALVFNRTVTLRDAWARIAEKGR
jgi:glutaminyl-tRNA synthetase